MSKEQPINLNISDFLKVFAVASVILQTVLSYVLTHSPQTEAMNSIGSFYRMSKYSAPMFIFAIIYNMVLKSQAESYLEFLKEKFYELVLPYVVWSSLYLYAFPSLQQRMPYETPLGFLGKVLSGDGAAHLWYAVMMLQFQLFMPYLVGNQNYKKQKSDFTNCLFYNRCAYPLVLLVPENDFSICRNFSLVLNRSFRA